MAISSSKLVVPTVTNTDFMAAGRAGAARGRRAPAHRSRNGGRAEGRDGMREGLG